MAVVQYTPTHKYTERHNETEYGEQNVHNNKNTLYKKLNRSIQNMNRIYSDKKWNQKKMKEYDIRKSHISSKLLMYIQGVPLTTKTRHFFNNSKINEDIATKQRHTTDTFLFIPHTTNVLLFRSGCNIFIGFRIVKEMPGLVGSGTIF